MRKLALLAVLLMVFGCVLPSAQADDDSLNVIVLLEDKQYSVGSPVKVTVHVFNKATHVDADTVPAVETGIYPSRAVSVSRTSTGVYEGTFTLQQSDLSGGYFQVSASATWGKSNDEDTTYNEAEGSAMAWTDAAVPTGLSVDCSIRSISTDIAKAGTKITVETVVKHNGTPVVPSDFSMDLSYDERGGSTHSEELTTTNPSVGTYDCEYTVPELDYDTELDFDADAEYSGDIESDSVSVALDFFQVIYHNISKKATEAVFDIYVADMGGKPVGDATLTVTVRPDGSYSKSRTLDAGVTDSSGKARVTLSCDNGTRQLYVSGYANASQKSQSFSGTIPIPAGPQQAPSPSGDDFEAVFVGKEEVYKAGQSISRDYVVFNNSKLWTNKEVFCYILSGSLSTVSYSSVTTKVEARTMSTDSVGGLKLTVAAPANQDTFFEVEFQSATGVHEKPGGYWGPDHDSVDGALYSDSSDSFLSQKAAMAGGLKVSIAKLNIGSPTQVSAEAGSGDPPVAMVAWFPDQIEDYYDLLDIERDWNVWSTIPTYMTKKGSSYSGTVTIPSFMPKDKKYSVVVVKQGDLAAADFGFASASPGQSSAPAKSEFPWMTVGIAVAVVILVAAVALVLVKRRRRTVAPTAFGQQTTTYPAAPGYQQPPAPAPAPGTPPAQPYQQPPTLEAGQQPMPQAAPAPQPPAGYPQPPPQAAAPPQPAYAAPPASAVMQQPQATAVPPPSPIPPPPPSVTGPVTLPNNALCAYCNQWILQGSSGILCHCGKYYHQPCAKIQLQCSNCGKVL